MCRRCEASCRGIRTFPANGDVRIRAYTTLSLDETAAIAICRDFQGPYGTPTSLQIRNCSAMSGHETVTMRDHPSAPETRLRGRPAKRVIGEVEMRDHSQLAS